jgi:transitional endoplasmic reticulum ATPase
MSATTTKKPQLTKETIDAAINDQVSIPQPKKQPAAVQALIDAIPGLAETIKHASGRSAGNHPKVPRTVTVEEADVPKMIIPKDGDLGDMIKHLVQMREARETITGVHSTIDCIPADGLVALWKAMSLTYEFTNFQYEDKGFFGQEPPIMLKIMISHSDFIMVPYCKLSPPRWEGGWIQPAVTKEGTQIVISGEIERKFEPEVRELIALAQKIVKVASIYKGKAVTLDLSYLSTKGYNFDIHSPKFMDVVNCTEERIILNDDVLHTLRANVFSRICQKEASEANGRPFRHGVLLGGPYGTGKTLAGAVTANLCEQHGITYFHLKNTTYIAQAIQLAKMYEPSVLFCEDIDQVLGSEGRDAQANAILNTLDGIDSKSTEVIVFLTTNKPDEVNSAMMRAGRIDTYIPMGYPDAKNAIRFLDLYAKNRSGVSLLHKDVDLDACGEALKNTAPAFINAAIQNAIGAVILRHGADITGQITTADIVSSATSLQNHQKMAMPKENPTAYTTFLNMSRFMQAAMCGELPASGHTTITPGTNY